MSAITKILIVWLAGLIFVAYLGSHAFAPNQNTGIGAEGSTKRFNFFLSFAQWDGGNYLHIAKEGYNEPQYFAFAPIYPITIKLVSIFLKNEILAGLVVSMSSFFVFIHYFHKYIAENYSKQIAKTTVITFIFFPWTFFTIFIYSESLFLLFLTISIYLFAKKKYGVSALLGSFSALTRYLGIFLILSLSVASIKRKIPLHKLLDYVLATLPFSIFSVILALKLQSPLVYVAVESFWYRQIKDPASTIFSYFWDILINRNFSLNNLTDLVVTVIFLLILALGIKKIPTHLWIFSTLAILIPATTGTLISMPRYALSSLGAFLIFSMYLEKAKWLKIVIWSAMLAIQAFLATRFIMGYWVA